MNMFCFLARNSCWAGVRFSLNLLGTSLGLKIKLAWYVPDWVSYLEILKDSPVCLRTSPTRLSLLGTLPFCLLFQVTDLSLDSCAHHCQEDDKLGTWPSCPCEQVGMYSGCMPWVLVRTGELWMPWRPFLWTPWGTV